MTLASQVRDFEATKCSRTEMARPAEGVIETDRSHSETIGYSASLQAWGDSASEQAPRIRKRRKSFMTLSEVPSLATDLARIPARCEK
jgi:hypothetical protein